MDNYGRRDYEHDEIYRRIESEREIKEENEREIQREREIHKDKADKICRKMHEHVFDHNDGEDMDLIQVAKDVYENFSSILMDSIAQIDRSLKDPTSICSYSDLERLKMRYKFLKTYFRCMLKWCVEGGGIIDRSLVDNLIGIESHFIDAAQFVISYPKLGSSHFAMSILYKKLESITSLVYHGFPKAYLVIVSASPSQPKYFMTSTESVLEYIDQVLENFYDSRNVLRITLTLLRNYFQSTKDWVNPENLQELLICVEAVVDKMACYSYLNYYCQSHRELHMKIDINRLELEIGTVIIKASSLKLSSSPPLTRELLLPYVDCVQQNLNALLEDGAVVLIEGLVKDKFKKIQKELRLLQRLFNNHLPKEDAERENLFDYNYRIHVEAVARNIGSFIYSNFNNEVLEGNTVSIVDMSLRLSDLLEKVEFIKAQVTYIIFLVNLNRMGRKFPQTDLLGFLSFLIDNLKELMNCKSGLIMDWKDQFEIILEGLVMFRSFLQKITQNESIVDGNELEHISDRVSSTSYEADCLINSFAAGSCPVWFRSIWISDITEQMKLIKEDALENIEKRAIDNKINVVSKDPVRHVVSQALVSTTDMVIGFKAEMEIMKERLACGPEQRDVVSIIGMPGLGKTTLAKKMYEDPLIVSHFQLRSWCCVSQEYNKKELLLSILSSIVELTDLICKYSAEDLSVMLHKQLIGRRYLIVVDDIWKIEAWDDLNRFFPDDKIGSRIMLTSRNNAIGLQAKYHSDPLELRLLTDDESWDLLKANVFHNKPCPVELLYVGEQIARKCKGLPLKVVVVAGLLAKSEKELYIWEQVAGRLGLHIAADSQRQWFEVLELSYKFLPNHLKTLFLYLGAFPEDKEISAENLIWLWIAEGFVQKTDDCRSLEIQAEKYLVDLIGRNLIMVAKRRSDGSVKTCRVHDLLHDFCLETAKKDFFLQKEFDKVLGYEDPIICQWRLSISTNRTDFHVSRPSITPVHSFLVFNIILWDEDIGSVLCFSKLLKVLHLDNTNITDKLYSDLITMVHLRYISVRTYLMSIPSSISNLWNLETLIIKGLRGEITMPSAIWEMVKLRHLHINDRASFEYDENSSKLENLDTLSTPVLSYGQEKKLIRRVPNLRKLRCIFFDAWDPFKRKYLFPDFHSFDQLESLKVLYHGRDRCSGPFSLPSDLKKLTLTKFRMQWNDISSSFGKLPNLEVLKLSFGAAEGELWDMGNGEFPKLRFLKLESLNIKEWIASAENFPCLKTLVFERCKQLKEVPDSLGDFNSLEKIEVLWCNRSAAKSAKKIQEDQEDAGNELLKVHVYPPDLDMGLASSS